jgi:hypothetical protein
MLKCINIKIKKIVFAIFAIFFSLHQESFCSRAIQMQKKKAYSRKAEKHNSKREIDKPIDTGKIIKETSSIIDSWYKKDIKSINSLFNDISKAEEVEFVTEHMNRLLEIILSESQREKNIDFKISRKYLKHGKKTINFNIKKYEKTPKIEQIDENTILLLSKAALIRLHDTLSGSNRTIGINSIDESSFDYENTISSYCDKFIDLIELAYQDEISLLKTTDEIKEFMINKIIFTINKKGNEIFKFEDKDVHDLIEQCSLKPRKSTRNISSFSGNKDEINKLIHANNYQMLKNITTFTCGKPISIKIVYSDTRNMINKVALTIAGATAIYAFSKGADYLGSRYSGTFGDVLKFGGKLSKGIDYTAGKALEGIKSIFKSKDLEEEKEKLRQAEETSREVRYEKEKMIEQKAATEESFVNEKGELVLTPERKEELRGYAAKIAKIEKREMKIEKTVDQTREKIYSIGESIVKESDKKFTKSENLERMMDAEDELIKSIKKPLKSGKTLGQKVIKRPLKWMGLKSRGAAKFLGFDWGFNVRGVEKQIDENQITAAGKLMTLEQETGIESPVLKNFKKQLIERLESDNDLTAREATREAKKLLQSGYLDAIKENQTEILADTKLMTGLYKKQINNARTFKKFQQQIEDEKNKALDIISGKIVDDSSFTDTDSDKDNKKTSWFWNKKTDTDSDKDNKKSSWRNMIKDHFIISGYAPQKKKKTSFWSSNKPDPDLLDKAAKWTKSLIKKQDLWGSKKKGWVNTEKDGVNFDLL